MRWYRQVSLEAFLSATLVSSHLSALLRCILAGTQDRRDRSRSRSRSHSRSRSRGRDRGRGRDRDQHRGRNRDRDRRSKERRADRPSHVPSDDGPSPRSITEIPIIAYADGGYEVCTSVPPDITVAALAAALFNAGMTPPPPVEYGSGAGVRSIAQLPESLIVLRLIANAPHLNTAVPTGPSPGAPNPSLGAEGASVQSLPPGVAAAGLPPGVVAGLPPGVAAAAGLPPGVAGASTAAASLATGAATAAPGTTAETDTGATQRAPSTVGSAPKLRHADNESMPPIRILDGKVSRLQNR